MKVPQHILQRWQELKTQIQQADEAYYQKDQSLLTDESYDILRAQLSEIEKAYPALIQDSPTQNVGYSIKQSLFPKIHHLYPLYSLDNVFSEEEMGQFVRKVQRFLDLEVEAQWEWISEPKIDGLTIVLRYTQGLLTSAATRGDGQWGEDITPNARFISDIPQKLIGHGYPDLMEVRGEIFMPLRDFDQLNQQREKEGLPLFANARNAAAGSLRQLDASITAQRPLKMIVHGAEAPGLASTYSALIEQMSSWGLPTQSCMRRVSSWQEAWHYGCWLEDQRNKLDYAIDGAVYKINDRAWQERLGYSARAARYAIAHKFQASRHTSVVEAIEVQVGRLGTLTPVAHLNPVHIDGVMVSRASLYNMEDIQRKDIRVGDTVMLQRAGDVIPQVLYVLLDQRPEDSIPFMLPTHCPICNYEVFQSGAFWRCSGGLHCPAQILSGLEHFVSRLAFNIEGLGHKQIQRLYQENLVKRPADFFRLTPEILEVLPGWGSVSSHKIISQIERKRTIEFARFLYALGLPHLGESSSNLMALHFKTLGAWWECMNKPEETAIAELENMDGIGALSARGIVQAFILHRSWIEDLLRYVRIKEVQEIHTNFSGQKIVFTGTLSNMSRAEAKTQAERLGFRVLSALSHKANYLIVGENSGQKVKQAQELGVRILNESEWLDLVNQYLY